MKELLDCTMEVRGNFILLENEVSKDFLKLWENLLVYPDS